MYKVLLIDDEAIIRKGLRNTISWNDFDCQIIGEAKDGFEGLEMIESLEPDIVFVDIRMPVMDGLEMIAQIPDNRDKPKFVILTGFSDFEYAREALALGVSNFLLKPTKLNQIQETLIKIIEKLKKEQDLKDCICSMEDKYYRALPQLKIRLLHDTILGIAVKNTIRTEAKELGMSTERYFLMIASVDSDEEDNGLYEVRHLQTFVDLLSDEFVTYDVIIDVNNYAIIIDVPSNGTIETLRNKLQAMQGSMKKNLGVLVCLAMSEDIVPIDELANSYFQCRGVKDYKKLTSNTEFATYSDITSEVLHNDQIVSSIGRLITDTISYGSVTTTKHLMDSVFDSTAICCEENKDSLVQIASLINKMVPEIDYALPKEYSLSILMSEINNLALDTTRYINGKSDENTKQIILKAIEYLEQNYHNHITLSEVAEQVYVSSYYISRIFRKETGMTMTEYLNDVRIRQACKMLKNVKLKVYQIGQMVGIADAHYFSRVFKSIMGVSPSEYRNSIGQLE